MVRRHKRRIKETLLSIRRKGYAHLNAREKKLARIVGRVSARKLQAMANRIRFQLGLKDRYYRGLLRSYAYLDYIEKIYRRMGLPRELIYLPHVESSFNYNAYSKAGAAGIWQFMKATARDYGLKISGSIDERRDPLKSTRASARFLQDNYRALKSWPLALSAYNHGVRGMKRAVSALNTRDINTIVENYRGRRFGFASKNFYATFMATVEISKNPGRYFPSFVPPKSFVFREIKLKRSRRISHIKRTMGLTTETLKHYNPAIRPVAYRKNLSLPAGMTLRLPMGRGLSQNRSTAQRRPPTSSANLKPGLKKISRDVYLLKVGPGETLGHYAHWARVQIRRIRRLNGLGRGALIYLGQQLKIPLAPSRIKVFNRLRNAHHLSVRETYSALNYPEDFTHPKAEGKGTSG